MYKIKRILISVTVIPETNLDFKKVLVNVLLPLTNAICARSKIVTIAHNFIWKQSCCNWALDEINCPYKLLDAIGHKIQEMCTHTERQSPFVVTLSAIGLHLYICTKTVTTNCRIWLVTKLKLARHKKRRQCTNGKVKSWYRFTERRERAL